MNPLDLLPSLPFALLLFAFGIGGYLIGRLDASLARYYAGRVAGMKEERTHANCRVIRATMRAFHNGVRTERARKEITSHN